MCRYQVIPATSKAHVTEAVLDRVLWHAIRPQKPDLPARFCQKKHLPIKKLDNSTGCHTRFSKSQPKSSTICVALLSLGGRIFWSASILLKKKPLINSLNFYLHSIDSAGGKKLGLLQQNMYEGYYCIQQGHIVTIDYECEDSFSLAVCKLRDDLKPRNSGLRSWKELLSDLSVKSKSHWWYWFHVQMKSRNSTARKN